MSYNINIGEPEIEYYPEDGYMKMSVKEDTAENAPEFGFGDISGKGNGRYPGYSQMSEFCNETGLYKLFFDEEDGLLRPHPGCRPITKKHLAQITKARGEWEKEHPDCKNLLPTKDKEPEEPMDFMREEEESDKYDWMYARIIWYEFWFDWALKNCKMPSISNS